MLTNIIVITIVVLICLRLIFQERAMIKIKKRLEELEKRN